MTPEPLPGIRPRPTRPRHPARAGFTLIEMMVVILLITLTMGIGIPNLMRKVRKDPLNQAISDLIDAFRDARGRAVLGGNPFQVLIEAGSGAIRVEPMQPPRIEGGPDDAESTTTEPTSGPAATFNAKLDEQVAFKSIIVNNRDRMAEPLTAIRFYPNGTCDQFDASLTWPRRGSRRISLEITTSLPEAGPLLP